jgi:hypothetical protein
MSPVSNIVRGLKRDDDGSSDQIRHRESPQRLLNAANP